MTFTQKRYMLEHGRLSIVDQVPLLSIGHETRNIGKDIGMIVESNGVVVRQLPAELSVGRGRLLFDDLKNDMSDTCPRIVLDCSKAHLMNRPAINLLVASLEEAMKRNGDVKLAAVSAQGRRVLELTGLIRLFEIFDTTSAAVSSFHQTRVDLDLRTTVPCCSDQAPLHKA